MLTKQQFKKHLLRLKELTEEKDKIEIAMSNSKLREGYNGLFGINWYEDLCIRILKDAMDDKFDNIGYFIYDLEFGKRWKPKCITSNGKSIKLKTIDDLYNLLTKK